MILILKTGSTIDSIKIRYSDFEDWIANRMELSKSEYRVHSTDNYDNIPPNINYSGIVITGSPLMVTDLNLNSLWINDWLLEKQDNGVPILGICFGHQLLTIINGGSVKNNGSGLIIGARTTNITIKAKEDELFGSLPASFKTFKTHNQSVQKLPPSAELLSTDNSGVVDAIRFSARSWGLQFHPEFNSDIMNLYIENKKDILIDKGFDINSLIHDTSIIDYGVQLLKRFKEITNNT